jgi:hypothetical protein
MIELCDDFKIICQNFQFLKFMNEDEKIINILY